MSLLSQRKLPFMLMLLCLMNFGELSWAEPPIDCLELYQSGITADGVYQLFIPGIIPLKPSVYCDMTNGGWTIIQQRVDATVSFDRDWVEYENGFGDPSGNFWLGLKALHLLTFSDSELEVYLEKFDDNSAVAHYDHISVDGQCNKYQLFVTGYSGTAGDSLVTQNGCYFSTRDQDNDNHSTHCAQRFAAWWMNTCHYSSLNGRYFNGPHTSYADGINWRTYSGYHYSYRKVTMKIRRL